MWFVWADWVQSGPVWADWVQSGPDWVQSGQVWADWVQSGLTGCRVGRSGLTGYRVGTCCFRIEPQALHQDWGGIMVLYQTDTVEWNGDDWTPSLPPYSWSAGWPSYRLSCSLPRAPQS